MGARTATVSIDIEATPSAVWAALVTKDGLAQWMGADSAIGDNPGEAINFADVVTGECKVGYLTRRDEGRALHYTWWTEDEPDRRSEVAITLEPTDTGTRVSVTEQASPAKNLAASGRSSVSGGHAAWAWRTALIAVAATALVSVAAAVR